MKKRKKDSPTKIIFPSKGGRGGQKKISKNVKYTSSYYIYHHHL